MLTRAHNATVSQPPWNSPLVITELVSVVVCWHDVCEQDVLGLGVHSRHLDLVAGEHPPVGDHMVRGGGDAGMAAGFHSYPFSPH